MGSCWRRRNAWRRDAGKGVVENADGTVDLGPGDRQGRSEGEDVPLRDLEVQAVREAVVHDLFGLVRGTDDLAIPPVPKLDADQQAESADVNDQGMPIGEGAQAFDEIGAEFTGPGGEVLLLDDLERGEGGGAGDGVFFVSVVSEGAVGEGVIEVLAGEESSEGEDRASESLANHEHVGDDVVVFAGEHTARAPQADRDFVEDQEGAVPVAGGPNPLPVVEGWDERSATHRLRDHGGDVAFAFEHVVDVVRAGEGARFATPERAMAGVWGRDVFTARQEGADIAAENGFTADGDAIEGGAVKGLPHRDGLEAAGGGPGELEGHSDGRSAAGGEEDTLEAAGSQPRQFTGEVNGWSASVSSGTEAQFLELAGDGFKNARVPEAGLVDIVAVEIEQLPPLPVGEGRAGAGSEGIEAGA